MRMCVACNREIEDVKDEARVDVQLSIVPMDTKKSLRRYDGNMTYHYRCALDMKRGIPEGVFLSCRLKRREV